MPSSGKYGSPIPAAPGAKRWAPAAGAHRQHAAVMIKIRQIRRSMGSLPLNRSPRVSVPRTRAGLSRHAPLVAKATTDDRTALHALRAQIAIATSLGPRKLEQWRANEKEEREYGPRKRLLKLMLGEPNLPIHGILIRHSYGRDVRTILIAALLLLAAAHQALAANGPIAFASDNALWRLDQGMEQRLPNGEGGGWPAWSPDGSRIAFTSVRRDGIFVMNADGTSLRRVTTSPSLDLEATWSPDGRRLAFSRNVPGYKTEIFVVGVDGKGLRRLTSNRGADFEPDWAPNGKRIAWSFVASRAGIPSGHLHHEP